MHWLQSFWLYFSFSLVGSSRRNSRIFSLFKWVDCGVVFEGAKKPPPVIGLESKQVLCTHTAWGRWSRCFWILSSDNSHLIWFHLVSFHPIRSGRSDTIWFPRKFRLRKVESGWRRWEPVCCTACLLPLKQVSASSCSQRPQQHHQHQHHQQQQQQHQQQHHSDGWLGNLTWHFPVILICWVLSPKKSCSSATFCPPSAVLRIKTPS